MNHESHESADFLEQARIAVVIQKMIYPETSGVLFTSNPITMDRSVLLVNSSYGLGESVVSSLVSPDEFSVEKKSGTVLTRTLGEKETEIVDSGNGSQGTIERPVEESRRRAWSLTDVHLRELAALAQRVETYYGYPQDIEWGLAEDKLYLLQARPITTFPPVENCHEEPRNRIEKSLRDDLIEHYPSPYPADVHCVIHIQSAVQELMGTLGLSVPNAESIIRMEEHGFVGVAPRSPKPTISAVWKLPKGVMSVRNTKPIALEEGFAEEIQWISTMERKLFSSCDGAIDPSAIELDSPQVLDCLRQSFAYSRSIMKKRFLYYLAPMMLVRKRIEKVLEKVNKTGGENLTPEDVLVDLDYRTVAIENDIVRLVDLYHKRSVSQEVESVEWLRTQDSVFAEAYAEFIAKNGARTSKMYVPFGTSSWSEDYATLDALIQAFSCDEAENDDVETNEESNLEDISVQVAAVVSAKKAASFDHAVEEYRQFHVGREESVYLMERTLRIARVVFYAGAQTLVSRGVLAAKEDAKYLSIQEYSSALEGGFSAVSSSKASANETNLCALVKQRRKWRAVSETLWWKTTEKDIKGSSGNGLSGVPGSPGVVRGRVAIISSPEEFHKLQPGDIMVCPYTDPTWTPLFSVAGAVVADRGGALSHAAIVAREKGIPAVLGVGDATSRLADGVQITVNGSTGEIFPIESPVGN